jgi:AraC-like DNA-binding protein
MAFSAPVNRTLAAPAPGGLRQYRGEHGAHAHAHAQVLFGVAGSLDVEVEGKLMRVDASSGLIVPPDVRHAFAARYGAAVWVVDAPAARGLDSLRPFALQGGPPPGVTSCQLLDLARRAPRVLPRRRLDVAQIEAAVQKSLHEEWPAARMAGQVWLSVPRFHARWLALTGTTPQAWLRRKRLDAAERLLRAGMLADAVAAQVGYASVSALLNALKRERGLGARAVRRQA